MRRFEDAVAFLNRVEDRKRAQMNRRNLATQREIDKLRAQFPGAPEDYFLYLREVGAGSFRECQFTVYGALMTPTELIGADAANCYGHGRDEVLCFGDNYSGDFSGFLPKEQWAVVELWHDDGRLRRTGKSFSQYIRDKMLMSQFGEDLRGK